jgi:hypothetical protein
MMRGYAKETVHEPTAKKQNVPLPQRQDYAIFNK